MLWENQVHKKRKFLDDDGFVRFGKYGPKHSPPRGKDFLTVGSSYLNWALSNVSMVDEDYQAIMIELKYRGHLS